MTTLETLQLFLTMIGFGMVTAILIWILTVWLGWIGKR